LAGIDDEKANLRACPNGPRSIGSAIGAVLVGYLRRYFFYFLGGNQAATGPSLGSGKSIYRANNASVSSNSTARENWSSSCYPLRAQRWLSPCTITSHSLRDAPDAQIFAFALFKPSDELL